MCFIRLVQWVEPGRAQRDVKKNETKMCDGNVD